METKIYIIEMPGKPPREVMNIKFEVVERIVTGAGGKIYPKPIEKIVDETALRFFTPTTPKPNINHDIYSWSEVLSIAQIIKEKYFADCQSVLSCQVKQNTRMRKRLIGRAWSGRNYIELSIRLLNTSSQYLHQVIYHEFLHIKFPGQGHTGLEFRHYEKNNPYRNNCGKTNRLSCVG